MKFFFLQNYTIEEYLNQGNSYYQKGNYVRAIQKYEKVVEHPNVTEALYGIGSAYYAMGNHAKAIEAYRNALRVSPKNIKAMKALKAVLDLVEKGK